MKYLKSDRKLQTLSLCQNIQPPKLFILQRPKWTTSILSDVKLHLNETFEESLICDLWHQSEDRTKMKTLVIYDTLGLAAEVVHQPDRARSDVAQYFAISHAVNALWLTPSMLVVPPVFTPSTLTSSTSNTVSNITLHCTLRKCTVHPRQLSRPGQSYKNNKVSDCFLAATTVVEEALTLSGDECWCC